MNEFFFLLMSNPHAAQGETGSQGGGGWSMLIFFLAIILIFYFFMIRPQQKRQKKEKEAREALQKGDKVVTIGGLHGKIVEKRDHTFVISIAPDTNIEVEQSAINITGVDAKKE